MVGLAGKVFLFGSAGKTLLSHRELDFIPAALHHSILRQSIPHIRVGHHHPPLRESQAYLYWVTDAKVYGMSRDHSQLIKRREVAMVAFGWFMRRQDGEEYEGYEFVGIFDSWSLDPPPPVVTDEWIDLHVGW